MFKSKGKRFLTGAIFAAMVLLMVLAVGCSQMPTQSTEPSQPTLLKRNVAAYKVLGESAYTDTVLSARDGGVVSLVDVQLEFPANALANDTLISISIPDISVFKNDFGTAGLVFNEPVKVVMSYRDADLSGVVESHITLAWYNEATGQWDKMICEVDTINKTVSGYLEHFSAYALISDR
jgi:hypothetical protein